MDARKAIEEGGSYLLVMTDWWKKLDKADAEKMQKEVHWKDCEEETCKLKSTRVGAKQGVQEQVPKNNKNESVNSVFQIGKTLRN